MFRKGHILTEKTKKKISKTMKKYFKVHNAWNKGKRGHNWLPVGTVRSRITKGNKSRNFVKFAEPNKWQELATYLWTMYYSELRQGDVTHHLNGILTDDRIENIIALPRSDHPRFHNRWGLKQLTEKQKKYYIARYKTL